LLEHEKGLTAPLELAQERHKGPDYNNSVARANFCRVERIDPEAKVGVGVGTAAPAGIGERVHRGDADRPANAVVTERFTRKVECRTAASERSE
jgi:hypothetical protein